MSLKPIFQTYVLVFVSIFLFLAATNIQGGWLFVIDSLLISLIIFSAIYPITQSKKLIISRVFKKSIHEDESIDVSIVLENSSNRYISFVGVEEDILKKKYNNLSTIKGISSKGFFSGIAPKEKKIFNYSIKPEVRGLYTFNYIKVISDGPFGLFRYTKKLPLSDEIFVYPNLEVLKNIDFSGVRNLGYKQSSKSKLDNNASITSNIREYKRGDSQKLVHWKATAKIGKLMVRELESEQSFNMKILIDTQKGKSFGQGKGNNFEYVIKSATSLFKFFENKGFSVDLVFFNQDKLIVINDNNSNKELMDSISELEAISNKSVIELLDEKSLDKESLYMVFFLDPEKKDIDLLNYLESKKHNVKPVFCKNKTFDKNVKINENIKYCRYAYIEIEKGVKFSFLM